MKNTNKILGLCLLTMILFQTTLSANPSWREWLKGSGNVIEETRDVSSFHGIDVGGAFEVILIKSSEEKVVIEADDNLMASITTKVFGGILEIDKRDNFRSPTELIVRVYYKSLDRIDISGAASLTSDDILNAQKLRLEASGASFIKLTLDIESMVADFSGASKLNFEGNAKNVTLETSGACVYNAFDLETELCKIDASGAAVARVWVKERLELEASGASSVKYKGSPNIDIVRVSGAASVRKY